MDVLENSNLDVVGHSCHCSSSLIVQSVGAIQEDFHTFVYARECQDVVDKIKEFANFTEISSAEIAWDPRVCLEKHFYSLHL